MLLNNRMKGGNIVFEFFKKKKIKLTIVQKRAITGYIFIIPLLIGIIFFLIIPLVKSFGFTVSSVEVSNGGVKNVFIGFENYRKVLFEHTTFIRSFVETFMKMVREVPMILIFSFFVSTILNQKFKGRMISRVLFFLPVIIGSGIIMRLDNMSYIENYVLHAASNEGTLVSELTGGLNLGSYLSGIGIANGAVNYIMSMLYSVSQMITSSGVQILIFLAALQTVSPSLFEASSIEGASPWDNFWKITFPMMTPYILVNCVYSIIDSLSRVDSSPYNLTRLIEETVNRYFDYGLASAMSWIYFIAVGLFLILVSFIVSRIVFYYN